jgi:hypothetical protein
MIKALTAIALLLAMSAVALAKQTPVERTSLALVNADMLDRSYAREHRFGRSYARAGLFSSAATAVQR